NVLPTTKFLRERRINFSMTASVSIIPEGVMAVTAIHPAGVIQNGIKTNSRDRDAAVKCGFRFRADITQPSRASFILGAGLGDEDRPMITFVNFSEHLTERSIKRITPRYRSEFADPLNTAQIVEPLVMRIK